MDAGRYHEGLRLVFEGRSVVCVGATVRSLTPTVRQLRSLGAVRVMVVGMQGEGVGEPLTADEAVVSDVRVNVEGSSLDVIRAEEAFKRNPPAELLRDLAAFDPDRTALAIGQFVNTEPYLDGRPFLSYRRPEWLALEDKTVIDAFFDRAGVRRADSENVLVDAAALRDVWRRLDSGDGVVWSGDAREGFNGGAEFVYWVKDDATFAQALAFFTPRCDRVRVMPFLVGVPCSIHGIVMPDGVAVLRPVEMVTLIRAQPMPGESLFTYRGCASFFEPPPATHDAMSAAARRVGEQLWAEVGFAGCFTMDGVVGESGFLPTEVNPRQGAGLFAMLGAHTSFPIGLLMDAIAGGCSVPVSATQLELDLRSVADAEPGGGTWCMVPRGVPEHDGTELTVDADGFRWALPGDPVIAKLWAGPRGDAGFVRARFLYPTVPAGPPVAPLAAAFWAFVDAEFDTGIGLLLPSGSNL